MSSSLIKIGKFILLSLPLFGTQVAWSFEVSYGTQILLSRGFTPFLTTLVWLAGPLTGLIVQPLIGAISDEFSSVLGRRRPFIFMGWLLTILSLFALTINTSFPILTSFVAFYILDVSLNTSMAATRSLMIDSTENEDILSINGWASRIIGLGSIVGYILSMVDFNFSNQISSVIFITIYLCTISTILTVVFVSENHLQVVENIQDYEELLDNERPSRDTDISRIRSAIMNIWTIARSVPFEPELLYIYKMQFFSWIAWFPIVFYNSTWLSKIASNECPSCTFDEIIRTSSTGMLFFSIIAFASSIILPFAFSLTYAIENQKKTTRLIWKISQFIFSTITAIICIISYFGGMTFNIGTILISGLGFSWAVTLWIPFVLVSEYTIDKRPHDAGALLGLTNIFIVLPQFVSIAFCSAILFITTDITWIFVVASLSSLFTVLF